jgi:hypothetical protein
MFPPPEEMLMERVRRPLRNGWYRLKMMLGIVPDWNNPDFAGPALDPSARPHAYDPHPTLPCCQQCGGGKKHKVHAISAMEATRSLSAECTRIAMLISLRSPLRIEKATGRAFVGVTEVPPEVLNALLPTLRKLSEFGDPPVPRGYTDLDWRHGWRETGLDGEHVDLYVLSQ